MGRCLSVGAVLLALALVGCGGGSPAPTGGSSTPTNTPTSPAPVITGFAASATEATPGQPITLTATFTGGPGEIDHGVGAVYSAQPVIVSPTQDTTYTLTVTNASGVTTKAVGVKMAAQAVSLVALKPTVTGTQMAELIPTFSSGVGSIQGVGAVASGVPVRIPSPAVTTPTTVLYTLTVEAGGSTSVASVQVQVVPNPSISRFDVSPTIPGSLRSGGAQGVVVVSASTTILYGGQAIVSPVYDGGTGAIDGIGPVSTGQSYAVTPTQDATYTLTVTNPAGDISTAQATVQVIQPVMMEVYPQTASIAAGRQIQFSGGQVGGAVDTRVQWTASAGNIDLNTGLWTAPHSPQAVTVMATSAAKPGVSRSASIVVGAPVASSLTASTTFPSYGSTFTLTPIYSGGTGSLDNGVTCPVSGATSAAITANWDGPRTYTLTVTSGVAAPATTAVTITPQSVSIGAITPAAPIRPASSSTVFGAMVTGGATNLASWSSTGGTWSGSTWAAPATPGTYTITATSADDPTRTASTTVTVAAPALAALTASNQAPAYGTTFTLMPVYSGGTGSLDNGLACPATGAATPAITANWSGPRTFTLTVANAPGAPATATVVVTPAEALGAISPVEAVRTVGSHVSYSVLGGDRVAWSSTGGTWAGNAWTGQIPGSYTITAASLDDPSRTATTTVRLVAAPLATNLVASSLDPVFGASFTLRASYQNGVGTIDNGITCPATGVATLGVLANWTGAKIFTLTVRNAAGTVATKSITVTPQVVSVGGITPATPTRTVSTATTFSAAVSGGSNNTVSWSSTAGGWAGNTWIAPAAPGSYVITATSTDDPSKTVATTVAVVDAPVIASFAPLASTITAGTSTALLAAYSGGTGAVDGGVGVVASGVSASVAPMSAATYVLTVTNAAGTAVTATANVAVVPAPVATSLSPSSNPVAFGGATGITPVFSGGTAIVDQGVGPVVSGVPFGSGVVTVPKTFTMTVTNPVGVLATTAVTMAPQSVVVGVVAPSTPTRTVSTVTGFSASVIGGSTSSVVWSSTGGSWSGSSWTAPATPGGYTITAASVDDPTKTATTLVTVVAAPGQPVVTVPATATANRAGYVASVSAQAGSTFNWTLSAGAITSGHGSESITWTAPAAGTMTISCSVVNAAGTPSAAGSAMVVVAAVPQVPNIAAQGYVTANQGGNVASVSTQPGGTYVWGITNGVLASGQGSSSVVFTAGGSGATTLTCSVANAEGVSSANGTATCTIVSAPVAASLSPAKNAVTIGGATTLIPVFSGGVAKIGTSGSGSSELTAAATSGVPLSTGALVVGKTYTMTVTNQAGASTTSTCAVLAVVGATASISASTTSPLFAATNVTVIPTFLDSVSASVGLSQGGSDIGLWPTSGTPIPVQASGFTSSQTYWLRAANSAGDNVDSRVTITPQTVVVVPILPLDPTLTAGTTTTFSCSSTGGASSSFAWKGIAWSSTGGAWNGNNWTAPLTPGKYVITAKSVDDPSKFATSTVNVVAAPVIGVFSAGTSVITAGASTTLTAVFTGGAAVVDNGVGSVASGTAKTVTPSVTTGYTLSVTNAAGTVVQANTTVTVVAAPAATNLVATLNPVPYNGTTVITPVFSGGAGVVDQGIGPVTSSVSFSSGAVTIPKTFNLTVTNAAGATATAAVTVSPQSVTIGAISPATPFVTVGYARTFASTVTGGITNNVAWSSTGGSWAGNTWTAPAVTGAYTITATSVDDPTKTVSTTATVVAMPVASGITTTNSTPAFGANFTLTPTYSLGVGAIDNGVTCPSSGSASALVQTNWSGARTYTLTVSNAAGATATANVLVTGKAVAVGGISPGSPYLTVGHAQVFSSVVTGGLTNNVAWSSTGGSWAGSTWTAPGSPGSYMITATSTDDASKSASTTVTVVATPLATSLTASTTSPLFGNSVTLSPVFSGGTATIGFSGLNSTEVTGSASSGFGVATGAITGPKTCTLTVTNLAGDKASTAAVVTPQAVSVGALSPALPSRTALSSTVFSTVVSGGATNAVIWSSTGGSWAGSTWTAPGSAGTYTVTATSADDPAKSASTTVTVVGAPTISSFSYSAGTITVGSSTNLTGIFSNGTGSVDNGVGVITSGSPKTVAPGVTTTYTLTVTNAGGTSVQASVTVTVVAVPVASGLSASSASPLYASVFTLTPTYSNGTGALNYGVVCPGSGSASAGQAANWNGGRTYTLIVTNTAGATANASVTVTPQVVNVGALSPANPTRSISTNTTFTTAASGGVTNNVTWSSSGGSWSANTWTAPAGAGSYTITATSVDDPSKSASTTVTVVPLPIASGLSASTTSPLRGSTFTLTPVYSNGVGSIDYGVSCPASGNSTSAQAANWAGSQTYTLTVTNAAGATATTAVTVTPQTVVVGAVSPGSPYVTVGHSKSFSASCSGGASNGLSWSSTGGGWTGTTWTAPGVGSYTITATSIDDPSKASSTTATVVAAPTATSLVAWANPVNFNSTTNITPNFSGGSGWVDQGVGGVANGSAFSSGAITVAKTFTMTVTNLANDTATASVTINVESISIGGVTPANQYITAGYSRAFSCTVSGGATNTVSWSSTGGSWSGNTWTAPGPGTYTITATANDDGSKVSSTQAYVVAAPLASGLSTSDPTPSYGGTFTLTPTFSGGTGTIDNGVACPASGAPIAITATWSGPRTYTLTVTNPANEVVSAAVVVTSSSAQIDGTGVTAVSASTAVNYAATVTGAADTTIRWSASAGSLSAATTASGVTTTWTAPATPGTYLVTATAVADGSVSKSWTVTVRASGGPVLGDFGAAWSSYATTCDDAMASGGYHNTDTYTLYARGVWDSAVVTAPGGIIINFGPNDGTIIQGAEVPIYAVTSGVAGGYCTAQSNSTYYYFGAAGEQWTLVSTWNGQQATFYFNQ